MTALGVRARTVSAARARRSSRRTFAMVLWLLLIAAVVPWWLGTPAGSLRSTGDVLTAAGRITGLIAGYVLLLQVLLMARLHVLDRWIGAEDLTRWHRDMGATLVLTTLAHAALIITGYADWDGVTLLDEAGTLLRDYDGMLGAFLAAGLMVLLGFTGIRAVRQAMPYAVWHRLHLASYAILLLGFGHQFANGQQLFQPGPVRTSWILLYAGVVAAFAWGRLIAPLVFNLRHRLVVADVVAENPSTISIYLTGAHLDRLEMHGGQFLRWRFAARGLWAQAHPFSLSAAHNGRWLRITVTVVGPYTRRLLGLSAGTRVWASRPAGSFTALNRTADRALLIAGGAGIAPIRALLEDLPTGAAVIYRASTELDVMLTEELDWLARNRHADIWYVIGSRRDPGPRQVMSAQGLRELVPDVARRDVYLCGPGGFLSAAEKAVRSAGVPSSRIHRAAFEF